MKHIYLTLMILIAGSKLIVTAQTPVYYKYDDAGNRTLRTITLRQSSLKSAKVDTVSHPITNTEEELILSEKKDEKFQEIIDEQKITIYPNPTYGELHVEIKGFTSEKKSAIAIYNLFGTLISTQKPLSGHNIVDLSLSPGGTYILKVQLGDKISEWKIVKE